MGMMEFIIENLFKENFIEKIQDEVCLEETESTGRTKLIVQMDSLDNYCIKNPDNNGMTNIGFFRDECSMQKRVDHIIFEKKQDGLWTIHLIEMKTTVREKKWVEIKGKFRASLLLSEAIASMLKMNIECVKMYTTFEIVNLKCDAHSPAAHRGRVGRKMVRAEDEWNGKDFGLNFGERINFQHTPIKMERNEDGLYGTVHIS